MDTPVPAKGGHTDAPPFPHRDRCGPPRRRHQRSRLNELSDEAPPLCSLPNSPGDAGGRPLLPPLSRGSSPTAPPLHSCFRGRTGVSTPTTLTLLCAGSRLRTAHGRRPRPPCASVRLVRLRTIASLLAPAGCARSLWRQRGSLSKSGWPRSAARFLGQARSHERLQERLSDRRMRSGPLPYGGPRAAPTRTRWGAA